MDEKDLEVICHRLSEFYVPNIMSKVVKIDEKCCHLSREVIKFIRQSFYLSFAFQHPEHFRINISPEILIKSSDMCIVDGLRVFDPLEMQSISMLIKYVISEPTLFAKKVAECSQFSWQRYLFHITIPGIFSFFSTIESAKLGLCLYLELFKVLPFETFLIIMFPYFNSTVCSVFGELLMKCFFNEVSLSKISIKLICQALIDMTKKLLPYLPEPHITLIRMLSLQCPKYQVWMFIIRVLIFPQLKFHSEVNPSSPSSFQASYIDSIREMFYRLNSRSENEFDLPDILLSGSLFTLPNTYIPVDNQFYIDVVLTLADIQTILHIGLILPGHFRNVVSLENNLTVDPFQPFFLRIFYNFSQSNTSIPRRMFQICSEIPIPEHNPFLCQMWARIKLEADNRSLNPLDLIMSSTIRSGNALIDQHLNHDPNIKELRYFALQQNACDMYQSLLLLEELINRQLLLVPLRDWYDIALRFNLSTALVTSKRLYHYKSPKIEYVFNNFWDYIQSMCNSVHPLSFWYSVLLLGKIETKIFHNSIQRKEIKIIHDRFSDLIERKKTTFTSAPYFPSTPLLSFLLGINNSLSYITQNASLINRFNVLLSLLNSLDIIIESCGYLNYREKASEILNYIFAEGNCKWLFSTIILIDSFLFSDEKFIFFCAPSLVDQWRRFVASFLHFLSDDPNIISQYGQLFGGKWK